MLDTLRIPTVFVPTELENSEYVGELYGFYHPDSETYNILAWDEVTRNIYHHLSLSRIAVIGDESHLQSDTTLLIGERTDQGLKFFLGTVNYKKETYSLIQSVFSRNSGILETDYMLGKKAIILGCGSVGSLIAVELAKAGVGQFVLVDNDVMNYHNICRHQCGIDDVGKYKVHAVRERIQAINPFASIDVHVGIVENLSKAVFDAHCQPNAILIGCADNREADVYACGRAALYGIPFISIGFWERAFAGEIYYYLPNANMPCYECAIGSSGNTSARVSTNRRIYTTQEDILELNFEPGISVDINFVTTVGLKLILDIVNRDNPNFTPRVINYLTQYTLICNTNDPKIGGELAEIFSHPLQITKSIKVQYKSPCPPCKYH